MDKASMKQSFSINKSLLVENLTETSFISQEIALDHWDLKMSAQKSLKCVKSCTKVWGALEVNTNFSFDDQRREKVNNKKGLKRKSFQEETDMVRVKKSLLEKAAASLSQDADKLAMDAESKVNTMEMKDLIMKLNSFRKTVIEKQEKIQACKENLIISWKGAGGYGGMVNLP